jgi:hypothetical protein
MSLKSDLVLPRDKFLEEAIPNGSKELNKLLIESMDGMPKWWEVQYMLHLSQVCAVANIPVLGRSRKIPPNEMEQ